MTSGDLPDRVRGFGIPADEVDGSDVEAVWRRRLSDMAAECLQAFEVLRLRQGDVGGQDSDLHGADGYIYVGLGGGQNVVFPFEFSGDRLS